MAWKAEPPAQLPPTGLLTFAVLAVVCVKSFLRFLTSLRRLWVWYIFSAATQDLGLVSGGMVIPYSQPGTEFVNGYAEEMHLPDHQINFQETFVTLPLNILSYHNWMTLLLSLCCNSARLNLALFPWFPLQKVSLVAMGFSSTFIPPVIHGSWVHLRIKHRIRGRGGLWLRVCGLCNHKAWVQIPSPLHAGYILKVSKPAYGPFFPA